MADQSQGLDSTEWPITARDFLNTDSSGLQHHDHQEGEAPPMGQLTMKELTERRNRSSLMSRKSSLKASRNVVDQVATHRHESLTTAKNYKKQNRVEIPQNSVRVLTGGHQSRTSEPRQLSSQTQQPKAKHFNRYEDAITNPIQSATKTDLSHSANPKPHSPASTHPSGHHPPGNTPIAPDWFARAFPTLLANPPPSFEPRAFTDEANALPLGALQASFEPLLRLVRAATLRNGAAERRIARCVWVAEGTRAALRGQYGWRAYALRSWVLKWGGAGWEAGRGEGVGEDVAGRVRALDEVALRAEVVAALEVLGDLLDRSRAYESWACAIELRHGAGAVGLAKGEDAAMYQSMGLGGGEGKAERMGLEEALEKTGPGVVRK